MLPKNQHYDHSNADRSGGRGFLLCPVCYRVGNMTAALRDRCSACLRDLGLLLGEYARLDFVSGDLSARRFLRALLNR